jgi:hypothetical protein
MAETFSGLVQILVTNQNVATIALNGDLSDFLMGGSGLHGDIFLCRPDGTLADTSTATIH